MGKLSSKATSLDTPPPDMLGLRVWSAKRIFVSPAEGHGSVPSRTNYSLIFKNNYS